MEDTTLTPQAPRPKRRRLGAVGLVAAGLLAGGIIAGSQLASAANSSNSSSNNTTTAASSNGSRNAPPGGIDPAKMKHGPGEQLVTGANATKLKAAALEEVPGATVIRVETDSGDAAYEVHLQKADGSFVTVKFDKQLNVTGTDDGFGGGPGMPHEPNSSNN